MRAADAVLDEGIERIGVVGGAVIVERAAVPEADNVDLVRSVAAPIGRAGEIHDSSTE